MKPCSKYRKSIAWLAAGTLGAGETSQIERHLKSCSACRSYLTEMSGVVNRLEKKPIETEVVASPRLHQRILGSLKSDERRPNQAWQMVWGSVWWRIVAPAGAVALILCLIWIQRLPTSPSRVAEGSRGPKVVEPAGVAETGPSMALYQSVANRSLDDLDELLTRQARATPAWPGLAPALGNNLARAE
jgi:anti-sigma factor RsiW